MSTMGGYYTIGNYVEGRLLYHRTVFLMKCVTFFRGCYGRHGVSEAREFGLMIILLGIAPTAIFFVSSIQIFAVLFVNFGLFYQDPTL